jgi:hypothetical protein
MESYLIPLAYALVAALTFVTAMPRKAKVDPVAERVPPTSAQASSHECQPGVGSS